VHNIHVVAQMSGLVTLAVAAWVLGTEQWWQSSSPNHLEQQREGFNGRVSICNANVKLEYAFVAQ
jgi:hypothetical protein